MDFSWSGTLLVDSPTIVLYGLASGGACFVYYPCTRAPLGALLVECLYCGWFPQHIAWLRTLVVGPAVLRTGRIPSTPSTLAGERSQP